MEAAGAAPESLLHTKQLNSHPQFSNNRQSGGHLNKAEEVLSLVLNVSLLNSLQLRKLAVMISLGFLVSINKAVAPTPMGSLRKILSYTACTQMGMARIPNLSICLNVM
jgi:hypothetical protein